MKMEYRLNLLQIEVIMARNNRHNKILEVITNNDIETQEELVAILKSEKFDITQATISRDIKELGLIKVLTKEKRYRYAVATSSSIVSDKSLKFAKDCVLSITTACNMNVVKCVKGTSELVVSVIEQMSISEIIGITSGSDTVLLVSLNESGALDVKNRVEVYLNK